MFRTVFTEPAVGAVGRDNDGGDKAGDAVDANANADVDADDDAVVDDALVIDEDAGKCLCFRFFEIVITDGFDEGRGNGEARFKVVLAIPKLFVGLLLLLLLL